MYAALAQIVILGLPPILYFVGIAKGSLRLGDVVYLLVPSALIFVVGQLFRKLETKVKNLPVADDELRRQRDAVVLTWVKKPLPDW